VVEETDLVLGLGDHFPVWYRFTNKVQLFFRKRESNRFGISKDKEIGTQKIQTAKKQCDGERDREK
jgi:hypothetical protein